MPGLCVPARAQSRWQMAGVLPATAEEADRAAAEAASHFPRLPVPANCSGDLRDHPDRAGRGPRLRHWRCESRLRLYERLGGEEGAAAVDACPETPGLRLEAVA